MTSPNAYRLLLWSPLSLNLFRRNVIGQFQKIVAQSSPSTMMFSGLRIRVPGVTKM